MQTRTMTMLNRCGTVNEAGEIQAVMHLALSSARRQTLLVASFTSLSANIGREIWHRLMPPCFRMQAICFSAGSFSVKLWGYLPHGEKNKLQRRNGLMNELAPLTKVCLCGLEL